MNIKTHWEDIHRTKVPTQVSWYQEHSLQSLRFIVNTGIDKAGQIIDVGGGISTLADDLLLNGYEHITVLDISASALNTVQQRMGASAKKITWIEADVTQAHLPSQFYAVWHDRAVFHFLIEPEDRRRYVNVVKAAVRPGGHVIVATFAPDGPDHCSGLEVVRYNPEGLHNEFGESFDLVDSTHETHQTPFGTQQKFIYCYCRKY